MNRYFNWVEYELKPLSTNPKQTATEATKVVAKKIVEIWDKASIPTVLQCTIIKRITIPVLDESVRTDLSTDQKYLFDICDAISKGTVDENLCKRSPGKVVHNG